MLYVLWRLSKKPYVKVEPYEYLSILSDTEWKECSCIQQEMQIKKSGAIPYHEVKATLTSLHKGGLIDRRVTTKYEKFELIEFKIKSRGDQHSYSPSSNTSPRRELECV